MKKKIIILFIPLLLLFGCDDIVTTEGIDFINNTDFTVNVSFVYNSGKKDSLILTKDRSYAGFTLFIYDYNKKDEMDSIALLTEVKKLEIYKIVNNDTIYVNPEKYNKYNCWDKYFGTDMRNKWYNYVLHITSDMFE
ncbi:MAG: hypothetical protein PHH37_05705 [Paludibacter sp.]|nr:hypothetical protein [Paludibacter sp.]